MQHCQPEIIVLLLVLNRTNFNAENIVWFFQVKIGWWHYILGERLNLIGKILNYCNYDTKKNIKITTKHMFFLSSQNNLPHKLFSIIIIIDTFRILKDKKQICMLKNVLYWNADCVYIILYVKLIIIGWLKGKRQ